MAAEGRKRPVGVFLSVRLQQKCVTTSVADLAKITGMDTDDTLTDLAWRAIRHWRRRREVGQAERRAWVRLYLGVIRRARGRPVQMN